MADINPNSTNTAQGSQSPVTDNCYEGWPAAPQPNVEAGHWQANDFGSAGGESNILDGGPSQSSGFALGSVPD